MKRPYRDVLVWLTEIRFPRDQLFVSGANAQAAVAAMLEMYDRHNRLAVRWGERFAHPRTRAFPFGLSRKHRELIRTYSGEQTALPLMAHRSDPVPQETPQSLMKGLGDG
jgi:hypothetical protein